MKKNNIDFKTFKAVMFDYDGTLTKKGEFAPSVEMVDTLVAITERGFPVAVCTGRQLESFVRRFGSNFDKFTTKARKNFYIFGENGAIGYRYDSKKKEYVAFYSGRWPREIPKRAFKKALLEATSHIAEQVHGHNIPIVLRPIHALKLPIEEVNKISKDIYNEIADFIDEYEVNGHKAKDFFHYGNSGLGCLVCPKDADKDRAILEFHKELFGHGRKARGYGHCREILAVGDNPGIHGNDHYFLRGEYGTPFTVGHVEDDLNCDDFCYCSDDGIPFPYKVFDENGRRLFNSEGTLFLLRKILRTLS